MATKKVIIVGAGVAGLSAGCYLRMNGYDTTILEMGSVAGGVAVGWNRKGYTFDGATTWLPGSQQASNMHSILSEIVDFTQLETVQFDNFLTVDLGDDELRVFTDADRLQKEMLRISSSDSAPIRRFTDAIVKASTFDMPVHKPPEMFGPGDLLREFSTLIPLKLFIEKWRRETIEQYAQRFESPALRELFCLIFPRHGFFSVLAVIFALSWLHLKAAGYPIGGSGKFVGLVEKRYRSLGGDLVFGARVDEILVRGDRVVGVKLAGGDEVEADAVISAADGHSTLFGMLGARHLPARIRNHYGTQRVFPSNIQVSLGIARTFEDENFRVLFPFDEPLTAGRDNEIGHLMLKLSNIDPTFAPPGKTSVIVQLRTHDHEYWDRLRTDDRSLYESEKERVAGAVIEAMENRYGNIESKIEAVDVATPTTYTRYTGNWKGSYQGWAPTPAVIAKQLPRTLAGLAGFYMAGQWVDPPGGLPRVIISGRNAAQLVCRDEGRPFRLSN